jgi:DNA-binding NtrC family response regulator
MANPAVLLCASQNRETLLTLNLIFERSGYKVMSAESETRALDAIRERRDISAVLLDRSLLETKGFLPALVEAVSPTTPILVLFGDVEAGQCAGRAIKELVNHVSAAVKNVQAGGSKETTQTRRETWPLRR